MRCILALVLVVALLPDGARRRAEAVSDAVAQRTAGIYGHEEESTPDDRANEHDGPGPDDSSEGLEDQEMLWRGDGPAPPGDPVEISRRRYYFYVFRKTNLTRYGKRVWCICEMPGTSQTLFEDGDLDQIHTVTEEEYTDCVAFGAVAGSVLAGTAAFVATSSTSPAGLIAMAAMSETREYLLMGSVAMGGFIGTVVAARICPKPTPPQSRPWYHCPTCPGCPEGRCPCPCPCPQPCPSGQNCPPCPPGCPQIPGPGGDVCRAHEEGDAP